MHIILLGISRELANIKQIMAVESELASNMHLVHNWWLGKITIFSSAEQCSQQTSIQRFPSYFASKISNITLRGHTKNSPKKVFHRNVPQKCPKKLPKKGIKSFTKSIKKVSKKVSQKRRPKKCPRKNAPKKWMLSHKKIVPKMFPKNKCLKKSKKVLKKLLKEMGEKSGWKKGVKTDESGWKWVEAVIHVCMYASLMPFFSL